MIALKKNVGGLSFYNLSFLQSILSNGLWFMVYDH